MVVNFIPEKSGTEGLRILKKFLRSMLNNLNNMNSFFGLPEEVKFCKKCVISNQRPSSTVEFKSTAIDKKDGIFI